MAAGLQIFIDGKQVPLARVHAWERKKAIAVLCKLGVRPVSADLAELRRQLLARKLELGKDKLRALLAKELSVSEFAGEVIARLSRGRRRFSTIEIVSESGCARDFVQWFDQLTTLNREEAMLAAAPEHYVLMRCPDGRLEVIETNGGSPLAARFFIDYQDISSLRSTPDPTYKYQAAGIARSSSGLALGGVRHQFRDAGDGYRAKLVVEFPFFIFPGVVSGHQWHLACEFSNWMSAYAEESSSIAA